MTRYSIERSGINGVFKKVDGVVRGELSRGGKAAFDALGDAALAYPDSYSPINHALHVAQGRAMTAVHGVGTEAGFIMHIAALAAEEYLKADDLMAEGAKHRRAAAADLDAFARAPGVEAKTHQLDLLP